MDAPSAPPLPRASPAGARAPSWRGRGVPPAAGVALSPTAAAAQWRRDASGGRPLPAAAAAALQPLAAQPLGATPAAWSAQEPRALWKGFVTGSLAAVAAGAVTHPIDLVKVRMQLAGAAGEATLGPPPGLFATAAAVVRRDGVLGLYSGISGSVLRQSTTIGARLGFYDAIKNAIADDAGHLSFPKLVGCGLAAGALSAAMCNPAELVLVRMQADGRLPTEQRRGYAHAGDALLRIARAEGVPALWRGTAPTVARAMVVTAAQMSFYDRSKALLLGFGLPDMPATHAAASLVAGGAAALSSNPFDVVKTRLQNMAPLPDGRMPYSGFVNCFVTTARTEGFLALYKGLLATWARQAPLNTVRFIALEQLRKIIG